MWCASISRVVRSIQAVRAHARARFASNNIEINRCNSALWEIHDFIGHKLYLQRAFALCSSIMNMVLIHSGDAQETSNQLIVTLIIYIAFQFIVQTIDVCCRQTAFMCHSRKSRHCWHCFLCVFTGHFDTFDSNVEIVVLQCQISLEELKSNDSCKGSHSANAHFDDDELY